MESQISVHFIHNVTTLPHFWVPTRSPVDDTISCNTFFKVPLRPCQSFCFYKIRIMYENFLSQGLAVPFTLNKRPDQLQILLQGYYLHPAASCCILHNIFKVWFNLFSNENAAICVYKQLNCNRTRKSLTDVYVTFVIFHVYFFSSVSSILVICLEYSI